MYESFALIVFLIVVIVVLVFGLWALLNAAKWVTAFCFNIARRTLNLSHPKRLPTRAALIRSGIIVFFKLQNEEDLFDLALKPRSHGGEGRCEEMAMIGDTLLNLVVVRELLVRAERVKDFVSKGKIQHWVTVEKQEYVTNDALAKFAYYMEVESLLPSDDPTNRDLGTICEALLGACTKVKGDTVACLVAKEMMILLDNAVFNVLQAIFQRTGHEMFKLVQINEVSHTTNYLQLLVDIKNCGANFDQFTKAVIEHEENVLKAGKSLTEQLLYIYEVSVKAYPGAYGFENHTFRGMPHPDSITAKRSAIQGFAQILRAIYSSNYIGRVAIHFCLDPFTNISMAKEPILQFLWKVGEDPSPRHGAPPPGSCGAGVMSMNPITLSFDQNHGMYSCRQIPPEDAVHPCTLGNIDSIKDGAYKHGGIILSFPKEFVSPPIKGKQNKTKSRRRRKK